VLLTTDQSLQSLYFVFKTCLKGKI
jgi:hypothetical protein